MPSCRGYLTPGTWAILSSQASEHAARMVAMRNASQNARKLITSLQLEYNKFGNRHYQRYSRYCGRCECTKEEPGLEQRILG
jgi:hypothetical protein